MQDCAVAHDAFNDSSSMLEKHNRLSGCCCCSVSCAAVPSVSSASPSVGWAVGAASSIGSSPPQA